jgi:hypothetical protein
VIAVAVGVADGLTEAVATGLPDVAVAVGTAVVAVAVGAAVGVRAGVAVRAGGAVTVVVRETGDGCGRTAAVAVTVTGAGAVACGTLVPWPLNPPGVVTMTDGARTGYEVVAYLTPAADSASTMTAR